MKKNAKSTTTKKTSSKTDAARAIREDSARKAAAFDAAHPIDDLVKGTTVGSNITTLVVAAQAGGLPVAVAQDYDGAHLDTAPTGSTLTEDNPGDGTEFAHGPEDMGEGDDSENAALDAELAKVEPLPGAAPASELTKEERDRKRERDRDALRKTLGPARTNAVKLRRVLARLCATGQVMSGWKVGPEEAAVLPVLQAAITAIMDTACTLKTAVESLEQMPMGWAPHSSTARAPGAAKVSKELAVQGFAIVRESARKEYEGIDTDFTKAMRVVAIGKKMVTLVDAKGGQLMIRRTHLVATAAPEATGTTTQLAAE